MELHKSNDGKHKYYVICQGKKISFGAKNYMDYTLYYKKYGKEIADKKKAAYIARHSKSGENWGKSGIFSKGFYSRWILWHLPTVEQSFNDIKKRFL